MTDIQKFTADIKKIIKFDRAENGGRYDGIRACVKVEDLFESNNRALGSLPHSLAEYWLDIYIRNSADPANEPSSDNIDRIAAIQTFLDGEREGTECLTKDDWKNLHELVDYEAEDLPLDVLEGMMGIILEQGAL
jgi:hypothetical protein